MTERDYILETNIRSLDFALHALEALMPNDVVNAARYRQIVGTLKAWRQQSYEALNRPAKKSLVLRDVQ